jgi:leucyl aminopeptidase (aminopeptidase T)
MDESLVPEIDDATLVQMASVITHCMNFKTKESVFITAGMHSWKLIEFVRMECARKGVTSTIDMATDRYARSYLEESPMEFLRMLPRDLAAVANTIDASISFSRNWDPDAMRGIPREKVMAHTEAHKEIQSIMQRRGVRRLSAGYPTTPMAKSFNITFEELKELIVGGMLYSQELLLSKCKALAKHLSDADRVHLKDDEGTDLVVRIRDRRISMSDGLISEEDQMIGYNTANLPTGEVFIAAHENFGDGTLFCR